MGFTVKLGELGHFRVSIRSEGSDTLEEANESKVKGKRLLFVPGPEVYDMIQRILEEILSLQRELKSMLEKIAGTGYKVQGER